MLILGLWVRSTIPFAMDSLLVLFFFCCLKSAISAWVTLIPPFRPKIDIERGIDSHSKRSITQIHSPEYTGLFPMGYSEIRGVRKVAPNTAVRILKTNKGEFTSHHDAVCIFIITKQIKKLFLPSIKNTVSNPIWSN